MEKKLSKDAYGGIEGSKYSPYVSKEEKVREITGTVVVIGIILAIVFAASNTYSALTAGLTVAAGIPGAILGGGLLRIFSKKANALNTNLVQGMASGGESYASGLTFVLPALFLIGSEINFIQGVIFGIAGGFLGIAITSLVHKYLIVTQHGKLLYPEGMAISETVVSTDAGGDGLKTMGVGAGFGAFIVLLSSSIMNVFSSTLKFTGETFKFQWQTDANPMMLGIGFIVGLQVSLAMFGGSLLANFAIIPLIGYFSDIASSADIASQAIWNIDIENALSNAYIYANDVASVPQDILVSIQNFAANPDVSKISAEQAKIIMETPANSDYFLGTISAGGIQNTFTKYIGAGMMLSGGLIGAIKLIPVIISSVKELLVSTSSSDSSEGSGYTGILLIIGIILVLTGAIWISTGILMIVMTILLIAVFAFLFAIVAARMTGDIGTSNLPVSGMTIASLLMVTITFVIFGTLTNGDAWTGESGKVTILLALTAIVAAISASGGYAQSQKATFILGGNKNKMQGMFAISTVFGVMTTVAIIILLENPIKSGVAPAPQANLMASITSGILDGNLPWTIIFIGVFMALILFLFDLPIMTVAIGFYLPMGTVTIILFGALIRVAVEKLNKKDKVVSDSKIEKGTIFSSGLIAGGALMGLLGAVLAVFAPGGKVSSYFFNFTTPEDTALYDGNVFSFLMIAVLVVFAFLYINKNKKNNKDK